MKLSENDKYGWKTICKVVKYTHKVIYIKDEENSHESSKYKVLVKGNSKKRMELPLWYDKLQIPYYLVEDTIDYNCKINDFHKSEIFKHMDFHEMENIYLIVLNVDTEDYDSSINPKIFNVYKIYNTHNDCIYTYNLNDTDYDEKFIFDKNRCYSKNGILILDPKYL